MAEVTTKIPISGRPKRLLTPVDVRQAAIVCAKYGVATETIHVMALWDTGATDSCITTTLAKRLQLIRVGDRGLRSLDVHVKAPVFGVDLTLGDGFHIPEVPVALIASDEDFDIIIGMDVINRGNFHWDRDGSDSVLTFTVR